MDEDKKLLHLRLGMLQDSLNLITGCHSSQELKRHIHTLKGNLSYFSMPELSEACYQLEQQLYSSYLPDDLLENLSKIKYLLQHHLLEASGNCDNLTRISDYSQNYHFLVTELAKRFAKEIRFQMVGGDLKIAKGPWSMVLDQLVHFIRNSADHGIEKAIERETKGKSSMGTITFTFVQTHSRLEITLEDDGRGVEWQKLASKDPAISSPASALSRIELGGISAQDQASDISGRGVGVSSIFSTVEFLKGSCSMHSFEGLGFKMIISLPLIEIQPNVQVRWLKAS